MCIYLRNYTAGERAAPYVAPTSRLNTASLAEGGNNYILHLYYNNDIFWALTIMYIYISQSYIYIYDRAIILLGQNVEMIFHELRKVGQVVTNVEKAVKTIAEKQAKMQSSLTELKSFMEEELKRSFTISGDDKVIKINVDHHYIICMLFILYT